MKRIISKEELKSSCFEALDQENPEDWWEACPENIEISVYPKESCVRYCFDLEKTHHIDDYYEYGAEAVRRALELYFKGKTWKITK